MPGLIDLLLSTFSPQGAGGIAGVNSQAGTAQGLPPLKGGMTEYGPWGAGGGSLGEGAFPPPPGPDLIKQILAHQQAVDPQHTGVNQFPPAPQMDAGQPAPFTATHGMSLHDSGAVQQPGGGVGTSPTSATSGPGAPKEYSRMMDPEHGPFRGIAALMGYPTRAEAQASRNGNFLSGAIKEIDTRVKQGMSPQKAITDYLNTPQGMQWLMSPGSDPVAELHNYVTATKGPAADVREVGNTIVKEKTPGAGDYAVAYTAPPTEKEILDASKTRQDMTIAAGQYRIAEQKYLDEQTQTGVSNAQKEEELRISRERLKTEGAKLGMDLKLGDSQLAKTQSDIAQAGKTPIMQDYDRYAADWAKVHPGQPVDMTSDQYKEKYTKLANPDGMKLSPALDKEAIDQSAKADQAISTIQAFDNYSNMAKGTDTGWMQAATLPMRNMLVSIGALDEEKSKDVATLQILQSFANELALGKRGFNPLSGQVGLTGNTSDKDLAFLQNSTANIWNSSSANEGILTIAKAQARRQAMLSSAKADYIYTNGNLKGWGNEQKRLIDATPFFTGSEQARLTSLNASATPNVQTPNSNLANPPVAREAPPVQFAPKNPNRERAWELLPDKFKKTYQPEPRAGKNARAVEKPAPVAKPVSTPAGPPTNGGSLMDTLGQYLPDVQVGPVQPSNIMPEAQGIFDYMFGKQGK